MTLLRLCYGHGTSLARWRRSHYALNRLCRCFPRPFTFLVVSHCVFVTSRDLSINTKFGFSDTHFCFNNDKSTWTCTQLWITTATLSPSRATGSAWWTVRFFMVRRRRRIRNRRRSRSCWVRPWLWWSSISSGYLRMLSVAYFKGDVHTLYFQDWLREVRKEVVSAWCNLLWSSEKVVRTCLTWYVRDGHVVRT